MVNALLVGARKEVSLGFHAFIKCLLVLFRRDLGPCYLILDVSDAQDLHSIYLPYDLRAIRHILLRLLQPRFDSQDSFGLRDVYVLLLLLFPAGIRVIGRIEVESIENGLILLFSELVVFVDIP